ncbi:MULTISPECIES: TIGR02678 family protein [unclassified Clostridium]|uniref:TIGR02678 family protein n=1 Tax=unclassified Clostridium TaxID=2614128 RepID=UPI0012431BBD
MEELKALLKSYIILKEDKTELYYSIKDNYKYFKPFITEKLGYNLILRSDFIKLEKLPGKPERWMGIENFDNKIEYVMVMLFLIFLEDKGKEEQFLLSHITEALSSNDIDEKFDWTDYSTRKSLIKVLRFAIKNKLIAVTDGDEDNFALDNSKEVLFESTGVSRYVIRNFDEDVLEFKNSKEFILEKSQNHETDRGILRKNRVYRRLLLSPIVYREDSPEDYEYIRNYRNYIEEDFNKYLGWNLHVHKNGALLIPQEKDNGFYMFPNGKGISDVMLHVLGEIRSQVEEGVISLNEEDTAVMNKIDFEQLILQVRLSKSHGWSKEFREMTQGKYLSEVIEELERFSFIREEKETIKILPLCGKVMGDYPKDYVWEEKNEG